MKALFLTNLPAPYKVDLFNNLAKRIDLTVLFERSNADNRNNAWLKNNCIGFEAIFLEGIKIGEEASLCLDIFRYIKKSEYDLFILNGYSSPTSIYLIFLLKILKIPFILSLDGGILKKDTNFFKDKFKRFLINSAKFYFSTSNETDKYLESFNIKSSDIFRVPFTSILSKDLLKKPFTASEKKILKKNLGLSSEFMILTIGQFIHRKGIDVLLRSIPSIEADITVCIIGGSATKEYKKIITENSINNINFYDFMSKEELSYFYKAADLFVLPTREDVWGLVINEAMSFGLPVISTNKCIGAIELLDTNKTGFIIPSDDSAKLSSKINLMLNNDELRSNMSKNALNRIGNYTIEEMASSYFQIFKNIVR